MGASTSWIAIKGLTPAAVRGALGLEPTRDRVQGRASGLMGMVNAGGWYVVMGRYDFAERIGLRELSRGADLVACWIEEHVMYSAAEGWRNGERSWAVSHEAEEDIEDLKATGELPPEYADIRRELLELQRQQEDKVPVDYVFEIPTRLARAITGFDLEEDEGDWEMLAPVKKQGWWPFGR